MSYLVIALFFLHMEEGKTAPNWCVFTKIGPVPHYVAELLLKPRLRVRKRANRGHEFWQKHAFTSDE
jgi:hypothetical protein